MDEESRLHGALVSANALIENQAAEIKSLKARLEASSGTDAYAALEAETTRLTQLVIELNEEKEALRSGMDGKLRREGLSTVWLGLVVLGTFFTSVGFVAGFAVAYYLMR